MITEQMLTALREDIKPYMDPARYPHALGVEEEMRALTAYFLPDKTAEGAAAGLLHDITRRLSYAEHLAYIERYGIEVSEEERTIPPALHAKTGAHFIRDRFADFATEDVIHAISCHTLADESMTVFDILLFFADFIEKNRTYEDCIALRHLFYDNASQRVADKQAFLYELIIAACDASLNDLILTARPIAIKTIRARNKMLSLLAKTGKK